MSVHSYFSLKYAGTNLKTLHRFIFSAAVFFVVIFRIVHWNYLKGIKFLICNGFLYLLYLKVQKVAVGSKRCFKRYEPLFERFLNAKYTNLEKKIIWKILETQHIWVNTFVKERSDLKKEGDHQKTRNFVLEAHNKVGFILKNVVFNSRVIADHWSVQKTNW